MKANDPNQDRRKPIPPVASTIIEMEFDERAFEQFGLWIDAELEKLVRRWQSCASPQAHHEQTGRGFQTLNTEKI